MSDVSTYRSVLTLVDEIAGAITGLSGVRSAMRAEPIGLLLADNKRQLIVASSPDLAEQVMDEQMGTEVMGTGAAIPNVWLGYDVYVLLQERREWDETLMWWRMARREEIRLALWKQTLLVADVPGHFRTDYEPRARVSAPWLPDTLNLSVQRFSFWVSQPEHS